jgi:hypothetical protein
MTLKVILVILGHAHVTTTQQSDMGVALLE